MTRLSRLPPRDLEALSAYADGRLSPGERQALEERLRGDPNLHRALQEMRATALLLRGLPSVRPPRSFTLTPEMAGVRRRWAGYPALQLATAVATLAFIVTAGLDLFSSAGAPMAMRAAAPAEQLALEAPAAQPIAPTEAAAAALPEAGAAMDALATSLPAPTATPPETPGDNAYRESPPAGALGAVSLPTTTVTMPPPAAESRGIATPTCEACSGEPVIPPGTPSEKAAADQATPAAEVAGGQDEAALTEEEATTLEAFAQEAPPEAPPEGISLIRGLEVALAAAALLFGSLMLWARHKAR